MMKIALVYHKSGIPGGHCEYASVLTQGLREQGAEVEFFYISPLKNADNGSRWKTKHAALKQNSGVDEKGERYSWSESLQCYYHSETGFVRQQWAYGTRPLAQKLRRALDEYDVVLWQDIGGFKNPHNETNRHWPELLNRRAGQQQVVMLHDHGALLRYPWLYMLQDRFDKMICVHPASYNMGAMFAIPRCMVLNPQILPSEQRNAYHNKEKQTTLALGAWKGSKKLHEVVMATPWLRPDIKVHMCGDGTERRYLTATDKCKPAYIRSASTDPDVTSDMLTGDPIEDRFWVAAHKHPGFKYWGPVDSATRDALYADTFMFIDPAWYSVNKQIDAHFSRVLMEALKNGIVPFARDLGLGTGGGKGSLFRAGEHYINIPWDATPKQFATIVNDVMENISLDEYSAILHNNMQTLNQTEYRYVAQQIIEVCSGNNAPGFYRKLETGAPTAKLITAAREQWFGGSKRGFSFREE